jgi:ABC-type Fe2+-enterobactin transport system substrate-binding protein
VNTKVQTQYHVTQLTEAEAEAFTRRVHNVAPEVMLGWKPYTFIVHLNGSISDSACYDESALAAILKAHGVTLEPWSEWHNGVRSAWARPTTK